MKVDTHKSVGVYFHFTGAATKFRHRPFFSAALLFLPAEHSGSCPAKGEQCQTAAHQNRAAVTVLGFFPDLERTQTGKAIARQDANFKDDRPKKFTQEQIELALALLEQGKTYRQITQMTGISKSTLIRARREA